jgi:drug/metabolite transporter (DMT)-like permease
MAQPGHHCGGLVTDIFCCVKSTAICTEAALRIDRMETIRQANAMPAKAQPIDWLILAALTTAWGASFAMTKVAVAELDAAWVMALRLVVAALVLVPYALASGQSLAAPRAVWAKFLWLGLIGHAAPFFLVTWGTHFVASGISGLLMGAIPLFLVVLAHFTLPEERLTAPKALGFVLGFAGIVVLIGPARILNLSISGDALKGELAILAGCVCYAVHAVSAKRLGFEQPLKQTASVCLLGAVMGLAFAGLTSPAGLAGKPAVAYWAVAGLGILPTALATLMAYRLMASAGPSFVSYANYLVPAFALLLGAAAFGETLSWNVLAALALILGGIAISRMPSAMFRRTPA